jgi:threonylcarbamoyladenosine tRNA methylthiotransferase MtaB
VKLHLRTFGCRANHYDTELVRAMAAAGGYEIVDSVADADVAVVNTCAVTAQAERDARKAVRGAAAGRPALRTIVMGCAAALPGSAADLRRLPGVTHVLPAADPVAIANALGVAPAAATTAQATARAVLRVQDGCDEHCTFCATTLARGANRSRDVDAVVREAQQLAERHAEIVITGTHIGSYGLDSGSSLGQLMQRLARDVPRVRFRLSSLEATEVDDRLAELFAQQGGSVVPHLHAPLQSGSDRLLRRMGRHWYTAAAYAAAVERLAARLPVFGLGADVIAGFPGETDDDHRSTVALIERLPFTYLHVFQYSPRAGTAATRLPGVVPLSLVQSRAHELRHLGQLKGREHRRARAGAAADLVVVSGGQPHEREAMSEDFLAVRLMSPRPRGERFTAVLHLDADSLVAA